MQIVILYFNVFELFVLRGGYKCCGRESGHGPFPGIPEHSVL